MEAYYYHRMDKARQAAYHAMKTGLTALRPSFPVPLLEGAGLGEVFFQLRLDCPQLFYAAGFTCRSARGASSVEFCPQYLFDKGKIREHQRALAARVEKLCRSARALPEREKEQYVHDFICQNVRYDKLKKPYSHEIIGPLGQGVGVCEGIAKSVKALCDALDLWCMIAVSDAAPDRGVRYRHAWNIVRLEGKYYHLDATFDNTLSQRGVLRYDYFNLDDRKLFRDHQSLLYPAPACADGDGFYYREKRLSFTTAGEVCKRAGQAIRKGVPLVFHWRGGHLTRAQLAELCALLEEEAGKRGRHTSISLNWPQAVLQLHFTEERPAQAVVDEEANEGERA